MRANRNLMDQPTVLSCSLANPRRMLGRALQQVYMGPMSMYAFLALHFVFLLCPQCSSARSAVQICA